MDRKRISQRNARRIVLVLILIAVGLEQYQWLTATQLAAFETDAQQEPAASCCELLLEREQYADVLKRSPFTLNVPIEDIDLAITAYGSVKYSGESKLVIGFGSAVPSKLLSVGEEYRGWTVLGFDSKTAELAGPEGNVTIQIKPNANQLNSLGRSIGSSDEDRESSTVREVEEIINANG